MGQVRRESYLPEGKIYLSRMTGWVSFSSPATMKDPCITRKQSIGIHDVVNDQGFAMHYRAISNTVSHLEDS